MGSKFQGLYAPACVLTARAATAATAVGGGRRQRIYGQGMLLLLTGLRHTIVWAQGSCSVTTLVVKVPR
jgi:hypothetical protein